MNKLKVNTSTINRKSKIINKLFHEVNNNIRPCNIFLKSSVTPKLLGLFMGILFFKYIFSKYFDIQVRNLREIYNNFMNKTKKGIDGSIFKFIKLKVSDENINELKSLFKSEYFCIDESFQYIDEFHICLSLILWSCNTEEGIINYYTGLQISFEAIHKFIEEEKLNGKLLEIFNEKLLEIFNEDNIIIPKSYESYERKTLYEKIECSDWLESVALSYLQKNVIIQLFNYERVLINDDAGTEFPDCGETTIRNFLNICFYNIENNRFEIDESYDEKLKEYYKTFSSFEKQASIKKEQIFKRELSSRNAWVDIVSGLENVRYKENNTYEIIDGVNKYDEGEAKSNLFVVISKLLNIKYDDTLNNFLDKLKEAELISDYINNLDEKTFHGPLEITKILKYTIQMSMGISL